MVFLFVLSVCLFVTPRFLDGHSCLTFDHKDTQVH